ncbi:MAG: methyltransferase domain-containing protein [Patescibacteria group bacterium]
MTIFKNKEEYKKWIEMEDWYQTINLKSGLKTAGKAPTHLREPLFEKFDLENKSFLDIGCNSGQYCFLAKDKGASKVVGIDIEKKRIAQAKTLAENEGYDIDFEKRSIFDIDTFPKFDVVFCIAVLTEIQDIFGAIEKLKKVIGKMAYLELELAKPIFYFSHSKYWLKGYPNLSRQNAVAEVRQTHNDKWVISPSFEVLRAAFGEEFKLTRKEGGVRYDLVEVTRVSK